MIPLGIRALLPLLLTTLGGCANLGYYAHSIQGQVGIWQRAQPIETLLADERTSAPLKLKLASVLHMRKFASRELGLPDNQSYRSYADLERPYVVWNVFATPEFSIHPKEWCLVFAGCVNYRGYFSKPQAEQFAADLRAQGYDVFVGGVPAYSTLGWFNDPVLNTFVHHPPLEIARLIFHELAHQLVYVQDDSVFNESFAVSVEIEGLHRWLDREGTSEQRSVFEVVQRRKAEFTALVLLYRGKLEGLYSSHISEAQKRAGKSRVLQEFQHGYRQLKTSWGGFDRYDAWFAQHPNNAQLASVAIYTQLVPAFQALLAQQADLPRFYQLVKEIGALPKPQRMAKLEGLTDVSSQTAILNQP